MRAESCGHDNPPQAGFYGRPVHVARPTLGLSQKNMHPVKDAIPLGVNSPSRIYGVAPRFISEGAWSGMNTRLVICTGENACAGY